MMFGSWNIYIGVEGVVEIQEKYEEHCKMDSRHFLTLQTWLMLATALALERLDIGAPDSAWEQEFPLWR